jgi:hypothetical protein
MSALLATIRRALHRPRRVAIASIGVVAALVLGTATVVAVTAGSSDGSTAVASADRIDVGDVDASGVRTALAPVEDREPTGGGSTVADSIGTDGSVPAVDDPEPVLGDSPGEVHQQGASMDKPVHPPYEPPPPPDPGPIALQLVASAQDPVLVAPPDPVGIPTLPSNAPAGDLTSNAVGCASNCITSALLSKNAISPDLDFSITTNVATKVHVWIGTGQPQMISGVPVLIGVTPVTSGSFAKQWSTDLGDLAFATTYTVIVRATDNQGNQQYASTPITTIDPPGGGQLTGNGGGCYHQCIESAHLTGLTYDHTDIVVIGNHSATFTVTVSTQTPGWIGGNPILPPDRPFQITQQNDTAIRGTASQLTSDTTYHVLVKATDSDGFTSHAIGQFHTPALPPPPPPPTDVLIQFNRFDIIDDADPGWRNRGEISLRWGIDDDLYSGTRDEEKIHSGTLVQLPSGSGRWVTVEPGGMLPALVGNAAERDWDDDQVGTDLCNYGFNPVWVATAIDDCDLLINAAVLDPQPLSFIDTLPMCSAFGYDDWRADHRCAVIESPSNNSAYAHFRVVVSFHIG